MPELTEFRDLPKAALPRKAGRWDEDHFPIYMKNFSMWYYEDSEGLYAVFSYKAGDDHMRGMYLWVRPDRRGEEIPLKIHKEVMREEGVSTYEGPIPEALGDHYDQMGFDVDGDMMYLEVD